MSVYSLSIAAERSIRDHLSSSVTGSILADYYTGQNNQDKTGSRSVTVIAQGGEEIYKFTNIYRIAVDVECREIAADLDKDEIGNLPAFVFDLFQTGSRVTDFKNDTYGFYVYDVQPTNMSTNHDEDCLVNTLSVDLICALQTI